MRNNITDSELLQWAEIGVQFYTALFSDGAYPHKHFSGKVCLNEVVSTFVLFLTDEYGLGKDDAYDTAQSFIGRIRPALDKRIAEEAVRYHRDRAVSKVLDTAAKARRNANQ